MRETPTSSGPSCARRGSARSSARLCASVLPKPMPGSSAMRSRGDARGHGDLGALGQERLDLGHDVVVARVVLHRARLAEHVHEAEVGAGAGHDRGHRAIAAQRRDVVDEHGAGGQRGLRDRGLARVDRDRDAVAPRGPRSPAARARARAPPARARSPGGSTRRRRRRARRPRPPAGGPCASAASTSR